MTTTAKYQPGDIVEIQTMDGPAEATVIRPPWGRKGDHISVRTNEPKSRTFVRLAPAVRKIGSGK